jgi:hypothetical protein
VTMVSSAGNADIVLAVRFDPGGGVWPSKTQGPGRGVDEVDVSHDGDPLARITRRRPSAAPSRAVKRVGCSPR